MLMIATIVQILLKNVFLLDHAVFSAHDLDLVRIVGQLARRRREESVHDRRVVDEVRPEADRQRLDLLIVARLLQQISR